MRFTDRLSAGRELGRLLHEFEGSDNVILALPRGGVVLGYEVGEALQSPLDLVLVRKIGHPAAPEYAVGAVADGGQPVYNESEIELIDDEWREDAEKEARQLIIHRRTYYFGSGHTRPDLSRKIAILVDDGIATGLTMKAALLAVADDHPKMVIVAVPVTSMEGVELIKEDCDVLITSNDPVQFQGSISMYYDDFPQVDDDEVKNLLERSKKYAVRHTTATYP